MTGEYERLKAWLESLGHRFISQSVTVKDCVATVEEDVVGEVSSVVIDDVYDALGFESAPWLVEEDLGTRRRVKFPVARLW